MWRSAAIHSPFSRLNGQGVKRIDFLAHLQGAHG
jgi:hypothetical protein